MKRIIIILLATMIFLPMEAQVGIGGRGLFGIDGNAYGGLEFSYQKLGKKEFDLGFANSSWKFTGLKLVNFIAGEDFAFYGGLGAGIGYNDYYDEVFSSLAADLGAYLLFGPIQAGLDWRPEWNFCNAPNSDVTFNVALSLRLVFGRRNYQAWYY
ncbi:MAG: hypothetical protein ACOYXB_07895 [Bacteroidota bacterium]